MDSKNLIKSPYYFDHLSTTPLFESVKRCLIEKVENSSGFFAPIYSNRKDLEKEHLATIKTLKDLFGAKDQDQLHFASSFQEAVFQVFDSHYHEVVKKTGKNHFLYLGLDELDMTSTIKHFEKLGVIIEQIPVNSNGQIDIHCLKELICPKTSFISLSWGLRLLGVIQPVEEVFELVEKHKISLHLNVSSLVGKVFFRFETVPISYLTCDPSRFGGPSPLGIIVATKESPIKSYLPEALPGAPMSKGAYQIGKWQGSAIAGYEVMNMTDELFFELPSLRDTFEKAVSQIEGVEILFKDVERLQSHSVVHFKNIPAELLLFHLREKGIYASLGGDENPPLSQLLVKLGFDAKTALSCLVFSFSTLTQEKDVLHAVAMIKKIVADLKKLTIGVV